MLLNTVADMVFEFNDHRIGDTKSTSDEKSLSTHTDAP
jgi:hypothetical protein